MAGSLLSVIGTGGYYSAYVLVIWRTVIGTAQHRHSDFSCRRHQAASSNIQQIFSTVSGIADQALFLTDLLAFFEMKPTIQSKPNALPAPAHPTGVRVSQRLFRYPGTIAHDSQRLQFPSASRRADRADRRKRPGKNHDRQADHAALRPTEGQMLLDGIDLREYDLEDLAPRNRRDLSGLHAL